MNWESYKSIADTNQWSAILPEFILVGLALSLLLLDMFGADKGRNLVGKVAILGQLVLLVLGFTVLRDNLGILNETTFSGMLHHSEFGQIMRLFFLVSSLLTAYLGSVFLKKQGLPGTEFYAISMLVTASLMLLVTTGVF